MRTCTQSGGRRVCPFRGRCRPTASTRHSACASRKWAWQCDIHGPSSSSSNNITNSTQPPQTPRSRHQAAAHRRRTHAHHLRFLQRHVTPTQRLHDANAREDLEHVGAQVGQAGGRLQLELWQAVHAPACSKQTPGIIRG